MHLVRPTKSAFVSAALVLAAVLLTVSVQAQKRIAPVAPEWTNRIAQATINGTSVNAVVTRITAAPIDHPGQETVIYQSKDYRPLAPAATTLLDTFTAADTLTFTNSTPRTYMGDAFTNNTLTANTAQFKITTLSIYMVSAAAVAYSDIVGRVEFWNTYSSASTPVFSNAAGTAAFDLGAVTTAANTFYTLTVNLASPITLTGGNGHNWGFGQNFQGNTGGGLADTTNLTSLITYDSADTTGTAYAAGQVTTGTSPTWGYFRNASGRTDLNFATGDARNLGTNSEGISIMIAGTELGPTAATVTVSGRVVTAAGSGMRGVMVTITDSRGHRLSAVTNAFGYYTFTGVPSGDTYIATASARGAIFAPRVLTLNDAVVDLNFAPQ